MTASTPANEHTALLPNQQTDPRRSSGGLSWKRAAGVFLLVGAVSVIVTNGRRNRAKESSAETRELDFNSSCQAQDTTLQLKYERRMKELFGKAEKKYETSSVIFVPEESAAYAICDSSWSIFQFGTNLDPDNDKVIVWEDQTREADEDSGYEAMSYQDGTFYVVRESIEMGTLNDQDDDTEYHAVIEEMELVTSTTRKKKKKKYQYEVKRQCPTEFEFEGDSKGFEGVWGIKDLDNELVLLGLCEGNHCSEKRKKDRGHGRIVAMKQSWTTDNDCIWETIRQIHIPKSANFMDYSAMAVNSNDMVALTSQEDSQLWIGRLLGKQADSGLWDIDQLEFDPNEGQVFDFPKDTTDCSTVYCNIEGIQWLDDQTLMAASDKTKGHGKQDPVCTTKDQSVHVFALPVA